MAYQVQQKLEWTIYSKAALGTTGSVRFFNTAGPSETNNIDSPSQIDKSALFTMHYLGVNMFPTDGSAWITASVTLLALAIAKSYIMFRKNGNELIYSTSLSSLLAMPQTAPAAAAPAYDISKSVMNKVKMNVPIEIPGGQSLNVTLETASGTTLTNLSAELVLYGILDRTKAT